jgi:hypothetical protein
VAHRQHRLARVTVALFNEAEGFVVGQLPGDVTISFDPDDLLLKSRMLVDVTWEDKSILMFASDLKHFAVPE